jgi:hypothetical protein
MKMRQVAKHLLIVSPDMLFRGLLIAFIPKYILETLTGIWWNGWVRLTVRILHIISDLRAPPPPYDIYN